MSDVIRDSIVEILKNTGRDDISALIRRMDSDGFFEAPCSTRFHLDRPGGLAVHSLNVYHIMAMMADKMAPDIPQSSIAICGLLHDLGKIGQYTKPLYIPNMLKGRPTKADPTPEPRQSTEKPYITNPDLLYVDHSIRSVIIASQYIWLSEAEQQAILWHDGLYGPFKYEIQGKETPLYMLLHWADMWASRVVETGGADGEA